MADASEHGLLGFPPGRADVSVWPVYSTASPVILTGADETDQQAQDLFVSEALRGTCEAG